MSSKLDGSFLRGGGYPLEQDYTFKTELELINFYSDPVLKGILYQGWLKVVGEGDEQSLYWVVKNGENLKFTKLLENLDREKVKGWLEEIQNKLNEGESSINSLKDEIERILNLFGDQDILSIISSLQHKINNLLTELDQTQQGVGLSGDGAYNTDYETYYLQNATSVMNALKTLDRILHRQANITYSNTNSVELTDDINEDENTRTITANVRIANDSDITIESDGLYHKVDLDFENGNVILKVNNEERRRINIGLEALVQESYYDKTTELLVIIFNLHNGLVLRVEIPAADLITEWEPENTDTISLNKTREVEGSDKLSAELLVNIRNGEGNNSIVINSIEYNSATGLFSAAEGFSTQSKGAYSHTSGTGTITNNNAEFAAGRYNKSIKLAAGETSFDGSDNATLFSIGNGYSDLKRHNAFELKLDGTIFIVDTEDNTFFYEKPTLNLLEKLRAIDEIINNLDAIIDARVEEKLKWYLGD